MGFKGSHELFLHLNGLKLDGVQLLQEGSQGEILRQKKEIIMMSKHLKAHL